MACYAFSRVEQPGRVSSFRKKFFNTRDAATRPLETGDGEGGRGRDTKFSFGFLLVGRFAFFGRANVILIARLSALLCEFARHFFVSFHAKLLMPRPEGTPRCPAPLVELLVFRSLPTFSRASFAASLASGETKIPPPCPVADSTLPEFIADGCFSLVVSLFHYRLHGGNGRQISRNRDAESSDFSARLSNERTLRSRGV